LAEELKIEGKCKNTDVKMALGIAAIEVKGTPNFWKPSVKRKFHTFETTEPSDATVSLHYEELP
jgi:hypothetical protein